MKVRFVCYVCLFRKVTGNRMFKTRVYKVLISKLDKQGAIKEGRGRRKQECRMFDE